MAIREILLVHNFILNGVTMKKNMRLALAISVIYSSCVSINIYAENLNDEPSYTSPKVSERELVDVLLGREKGPNSPFMTIEDNKNNISVPKFGAGEGNPTITQSSENAPPHILDETRGIRNFSKFVLWMGGLADGEGKRLISLQFDLKQSESNKLHLWATRENNRVQEMQDIEARRACAKYMSGKSKMDLNDLFINFQISMEKKSKIINDAWKLAESSLLESVDYQTYEKSIEHIAKMSASRTAASFTISDSDATEGKSHDEASILLANIKGTDDYCSHTLLQPK